MLSPPRLLQQARGTHLRWALSQHFVQDGVGGAKAFFFIGGAFRGLENPQRLAVVPDLDGLAGARDAALLVNPVCLA